ncbi:MAG TPA: transglutaminase-like domain-containing protein [Kiritimatiellia bacterium]|nr:transglutaminase-like domain-containing protein [Kiritimatiellia bacterium]HRU70045.1 transglutaminase-like domain-containing protein [Kiritimatiellia bacterium]
MIRSRWPVFFNALFLLWCAWWYCRDGGMELLVVAGGLAALAWVRGRALPGSTRWVIWGGIVLTVVCLAANVERIVPPDDAMDESRTLDRVITVVFACGVTALFFRPSAQSVTLAVLGGIPLAMTALGRPDAMPGAVGDAAPWMVGGTVALMLAADLAQRMTQKDCREQTAPGARELAWRLAALCLVTGTAWALREPLERAVKQAQRQLHGWMFFSERLPKGRMSDLNLTLPVPHDFGMRTRVVAVIRSDSVPGYLRESVYLRYGRGRWDVVAPHVPLVPSAAAGGAARPQHPRYPLRAAAVPVGRRETWRVEILAPRLLGGFCLPGTGVALTCAGAVPLTETNGSVTVQGPFPDAYEVEVEPRRVTDTAWPYPDGDEAVYLDVPEPLAAAVSSWVESCAGLEDAPSVSEAVRRVEADFSARFVYRLGLKMRARPDPLIDFMARREGTCTFFASAATLMFRQCGIPARVVGGFVCSGWNPWLARWVVRERDGHAWVEVWDSASGRWLIADPTPPEGRPLALQRPGRFRLALDLLTASWRRALAYLRNTNFLQVLADGGEIVILFLWQTVWSVPGAVVALGLGCVAWLRRRNRRHRMTPETRLRAELARAMARVERRALPAPLRRRPPESWAAWQGRVAGELPGERATRLAKLLERYQTIRYSVALDEAAAREWLEQARAFKSG